ncbi:uncharacterized protein PV09_00548 [Verruconis gallopava]|uniref:Uncharacterized protein n=1 Tax=Verruconis gallopava TaxID=253628 RepID=A0A0D2AQ19_9PEZI|nr:uncharacterized protein PV09_00548 [Verruconis gallopava]KIW08585.1 hypothetical protein PV09_00548 [Verruconis gallopava]
MSEFSASFRSSNLRGTFVLSKARSKVLHANGNKPAKTRDVKHFPFFGLPRELRDRVYRMVLVAPFIYIDLVSCASDDDDEETLTLYPLPKFRTTYISLGKKMTYRLMPSHKCRCGQCPTEFAPQLQLFYVSRAMYVEAREVFYKENEFKTELASGLGCSAWLKDREYSLKYIRSLNFDVALHTAEFNYGRWSENCYKALFGMLRERTDLRHLTLNFHGLVPDVTIENGWQCPCDCQEFEHPLLQLGHVIGMPGLPISRTTKIHDREWGLLKALTMITNLQRLAINVDFCYHMLDHDGHDDNVFEHDHIRSFIAYMRSRMLKRGAELSSRQIHGYCRVHDEVEDKRYRFHCDDDEYGKSYLTLLKTATHSPSHHNHSDSGSEMDSHMSEPEGATDNEDEWEDESDLLDEDIDISSGVEEEIPPLESNNEGSDRDIY